MQMLLFPDPRPLVDRLGAEFFKTAPQNPGVYLMRDAQDEVLYVGKARNLRKRLASYRIANPERLRRRHLRLLRSVSRIEFEPCSDETSALAREAELLLALRPRFNRAGTWRGPARFFCWRFSSVGLDLAVTDVVEEGWHGYGPLGSSARWLRVAVVRLLWCAADPGNGLCTMPQGWFHGRMPSQVTVPLPSKSASRATFDTCLGALMAGDAEKVISLFQESVCMQRHPFVIAILEADLQFLVDFAARRVSEPRT